jgi:Domain of unknown function (DUF2703)
LKKTLKIEWQRLVDQSGDTCQRCNETGKSLDSAFAKLSQALAPVGIQVMTVKSKISPRAFKKDPTKSNEIRINRKSLEEWLGGMTGTSSCCDVCGDAECRTTTTAGGTYEAIPENLILQAGLLATASLLGEDK